MTTKIEKFWIAIMHRNKEWRENHPPFRLKWSIGRLKFCFLKRQKDPIWGRFGGGWNWKFGFQSGGRTLIISLLIAEFRVEIKRKVTNDEEKK